MAEEMDVVSDEPIIDAIEPKFDVVSDSADNTGLLRYVNFGLGQ